MIEEEKVAGQCLRVAASSNNSFTEDEVHRLKAGFLKAYRWQYIFSGVEHPRYQTMLTKITTAAQRQRLGDALAAL